MITNISYNVLIERFRAFAEGHYLIKGFTHGDPSNVNLEKGVEFPWMHVFPVEVAPQSGSRLYSFIITFADLPRDKETPPEYQREMLSDCIRLAEDLLAEIQNGLTLFGTTVELDGAASIECFINEFSHTLTGVNLSLTLSVPWDWSACDIPADWSVGGSGSGGTGAGQGGITLETNGILNGDQTLLNLQQGANVTIVDNGSGTITISAAAGSINWGDIGGTLSDQTDLQTALDAKANSADLGPTAFSNDYNDLDNLPTIPANIVEDVTASAPILSSGGTTPDISIPPANLFQDGFLTSADFTAFYNKFDAPTGASSDYLDGTGTPTPLPSIPPAQVNSDWNSVSGVSEILNKPTIPAAQVNSDWNSVSGLSQILNKPTIPSAQIQSDWNQANTSALDFIKNKPTITTPVNADWNAVSGLAQILNKPTIPAAQVNSDWNASSGLAQILNKPTIPAAQVNSDWNASSGLAQILNKPTIPTTLDSLTDVTAPSPTNGQVLTWNGSAWVNSTPTTGSGTVTSVGTTGLISGGPITTSGTITTAMDTNKLVGRYTAGTGIMEEITVGSGLTLTGAGVLNNTATPTPTGYYAQYQDVLTQTIAVINTGYPIKFRTLDLSNGVSVVSNSRITFANTGIYNLQFSVQLENSDTQEHDVTIWLRKNGVDFPGSAGFVAVVSKHGGVNGHVLPSWNYLLDVVGGDYYELVWSATSTQVTMPFYAAGSPPPSTASAIFTVTQQAGIMAGTGITAINSLTGAAQTIGVGTSGTDFAVSSSGTAHTLNLPTASASNRGALSSADWSTFNGKQAALVSGTTIKTVNSTSLLGSGDVAVQPTLVSGTNIKTINSNSILGSGNLTIAATAAMVIATNPNVVVQLSSTRFFSPIDSQTTGTNEGAKQVPMPIAGTIKNFYVRMATAQPAGGSLVLTLRKNAVSQSVTVTFSSTDGANVTKSDTVNSFTVAAGDLISIQAANANTANSGTVVSMSFTLQA